MTQRTVVQPLDDLDGSDITDTGETIEFDLDGAPYEIDLGAQHVSELRAALQPFLATARRHPGPQPRRRTSTS